MGFFSSLFGSSKKSFSFNCPMCERTYNAEFDTEEAAECEFYERSNYYRRVNDINCDFCKTDLIILFAKDGSKIKALDAKWDKVERKYDVDSEKAQEALDDIEDEIDDEGSAIAREKKKAQLEARIENLDDAYEKKEEKYNNRQFNWQEKWQDKLERMG